MKTLIIKLNSDSNPLEKIIKAQPEIEINQIEINDFDSFKDWDKLLDEMVIAKKIITLI
jgi:hypothetical protein